ncbi:hypothetical protein JKP88DRAFT_284476 [Tribonema minus]|uniref:Uncharacterized protein n=1 Tax=Tribonema minus TaxID=303371 RepID=A0A835ZHQ5_9STRA|nr:hypothetical protein JKP88DRAFT_284476 [Tribonema minus]
MAAAQRVSEAAFVEQQRYAAAVQQLRGAGLISGTQTDSSQFKKCALTCAWNVWLDGDSFDGGAEVIRSALQQHQDDHGNGTFSSASVWSQLIERDAAQLSTTMPCDRFSKVWVRASAEDKGVIWRTLIKVLQRTPFLVGYRFLRLLPGDKPPDTATASGFTPWRKERGQTVDVPPPPPPPGPFDRLVYVNAHGFNDFEVNGGILSDAYEAVHTLSPRLGEQLRPLLVNKHTAFDEWESDEKAQLSTIILRLCEFVHTKEDETGTLAGILDIAGGGPRVAAVLSPRCGNTINLVTPDRESVIIGQDEIRRIFTTAPALASPQLALVRASGPAAVGLVPFAGAGARGISMDANVFHAFESQRLQHFVESHQRSSEQWNSFIIRITYQPEEFHVPGIHRTVDYFRMFNGNMEFSAYRDRHVSVEDWQQAGWQDADAADPDNPVWQDFPHAEKHSICVPESVAAAGFGADNPASVACMTEAATPYVAQAIASGNSQQMLAVWERFYTEHGVEVLQTMLDRYARDAAAEAHDAHHLRAGKAVAEREKEELRFQHDQLLTEVAQMRAARDELLRKPPPPTEDAPGGAVPTARADPPAAVPSASIGVPAAGNGASTASRAAVLGSSAAAPPPTPPHEHSLASAAAAAAQQWLARPIVQLDISGDNVDFEVEEQLHVDASRVPLNVTAWGDCGSGSDDDLRAGAQRVALAVPAYPGVSVDEVGRALQALAA